MVRILLLDCTKKLMEKLRDQGFNVEAGTAGLCTGHRSLPSQIYEKDVFIYNPESCSDPSSFFKNAGGVPQIKDDTPEYNIEYLEERIRSGGTFVAFVNHLSTKIERENFLYRWIPFMPKLESTSDKLVWPNPFSDYKEEHFRLLAPLITPDQVSIPVRQKLIVPKPADYPSRLDVDDLFFNSHGHSLGVVIGRGRGWLIVLPQFQSNEDVVDTLVHRVLPRIYKGKTRDKLIDLYSSSEEEAAGHHLGSLVIAEKELKEQQEKARVALADATRKKINTIENDPTAKQIQIYYDHALRQDDASLYYLYKIVEVIGNKFGGEAAGITSVGESVAWKAVKRLANESYRDARHAPKAGDVIKKWTSDELKQGFTDTQKVIAAYFKTLF
jgi:hypothetical protein